MDPKISVIVPVYKVEQYLHRCVDSILSQSFTDFELILVDDGSPDNCGKICDEYAQKDSRVKVFHKPNGGVSSARNLGLDNAKGEWIAFIDSDDFVDGDYLCELYSSSEEYNADFVATVEYKVNNVNQTTTYLVSDNFSLLFTLYKFDYGPTPWGKLYRTNIITGNDIRFMQGVHSGEDSIFVYHYLLNTKDIVLIFSDKYYYDRTIPNSLSNTSFNCPNTCV
jgi:glycosyltransferase involved in cell wall biosynthesis